MRSVSTLGLAIGFTVFAWCKGWRWWALIPGSLCVLMRLAAFGLMSDPWAIMSDTSFLLIVGQYVCIAVLAIMVLIGRGYLDD